ncbi:MAG: tyrosine-type recombinase/integrase [Candidatus Hodarchaeota archaeon]
MAKKERGIFERPKGSGIWWVRYADNFGRIHREKVGPKGLAKTVYQKRKTDVREGKFFPEKIRRKREILFDDMVKLFLRDHSQPNKRSYRDDIYRVKRLLDTFGGKALSEISTQDIERFKARLAREVSPATVNRHLTLLKTILNKAVEWGKTEANPAKGVKLFRENNQRVRFLSDDEEVKLEPVFPSKYWHLVEFAIHTGMRKSEMFNLRWTDINFQTRVITIPRSKSGEMRHIPMNDRIVEILRGLPSRMKGEWVFPSLTGTTPMGGDNFTKRVFDPTLKKAGIEDFRWHDLRHTFASRLVMKGNDLTTVRELMGHKDIKMTLRYSHLSPAHKMSAVQSLIQSKKEGQTETGTDTTKKEGLDVLRKPS